MENTLVPVARWRLALAMTKLTCGGLPLTIRYDQDTLVDDTKHYATITKNTIAKPTGPKHRPTFRPSRVALPPILVILRHPDLPRTLEHVPREHERLIGPRFLPQPADKLHLLPGSQTVPRQVQHLVRGRKSIPDVLVDRRKWWGNGQQDAVVPVEPCALATVGVKPKQKCP